jgi:hypothetical protein
MRKDKDQDDKLIEPTEEELESRRDFLAGLGKWSKVAIGTVLLGAAPPLSDQAQSWRNWARARRAVRSGRRAVRRGLAWYNYGRVWVNRPINWANGGSGWYNVWVNTPE